MSGFVPRFLRSRAVLPVAVVLTVLLALPSMRLGFIWDDLVHRQVLTNAGPGDAAMDLFRFVDATGKRDFGRVLLPWWTAHELRLMFWRPLSSLTHWVDYRITRDDPRGPHLHSILWGATLTLMAGLLYRRLVGPGIAAGIATLLFAVDDAHNAPIAWIANRNSLVASAFAMGALLAHDSWRRRGWRAGAFVGPALFTCALLGGEFGAGIGPFLVGYALFVDPEPTIGRRAMTVAPYVGVGLVWQASYTAMGFGIAHSGFYIDPLRDPLRFLELVPRRMLLLLEAQFGLVSADILPLFAARLQNRILVFCGLFVLLVAVALRSLIVRDRTARFLCFGMAVSLLPVCATVPSDRLLLLSGFGAFGLLGLWVARVAEGVDWRASSRWARTTMQGFAVLMILIHGPLAAFLFPLRIGQMRAMDARTVKKPARDMPAGPNIGKQHLVCVTTLGPFLLAMTMLQRKELGLPTPEAFIGLAPASTSVRITRVDERTLRIEPDGGFFAPLGTLSVERGPEPPVSLAYWIQLFEDLFRERDAPWHAGDGRDQGSVAIRVAALMADQRPAAIEARFGETLESPAYAWMIYTEGKYESWVPPAVGETTRTNAADLALK
jgi:hypothetical protein